MKLCLAPCVLDVKRNDYLDIINNAIIFLKGKNKTLLQSLEKDMQEASAQEQFEKAAIIRPNSLFKS